MANAKLGTKAVGSIVKLKVNGAAKEFIVVHQGKPSSIYDESCNGTWLLMKDIYENRQWNSSDSNVYETSTINTYLNGPFLGMFDSAVQGIIKQVKIPYRKNGGSSGTDQSGANGLSAKIFLLSSNEVGWTTSDSLYFPVDGAKLDYFGASSGGNSKRIAYLNGSAAFWWLRSQFILNAVSAWYVYSDGYFYNSGASESYGIRPALVLPSDTLVDDSGNVVTVDLTAHKTLVNGTAYEVEGGKCMVNGTVYNILKGRTLIDGTGYDITFPSALTMPVKGDLITMNLDGTDRQYRVLKIVDGTTVEVLSMEDAGSSVFGSSNTYAGNTLDAYLNTTCYNTLSTAAKAAIVPKNIAQYRYNYSASVYNATTHSSFAVFSTKALYAGIGDRYVYALGVEDIEDYFNHTFSNADIWGLFWNTTTKPSGGGFPWLRDASTYINRYVWEIDYSNGYVGNSASYNSGRIRPAFQIDLSKIDFTIGGGSVSKTWTFNSTVNSPASTLTILYANFTSNGTKFKAFNCDVLAGALNLSYLYLNQDASHTQLNVYYYNWQNEAYRTVIFDEAPSGDLLTWLQANATPQ